MFTSNQLLDILERAAATYLQTFAGLLAVANLGVDALADLSTLKTCAVAAAPAALSVLKSALAIKVPFGDASGSLLRVGYETIRTIEVPAKAPRKRASSPRKAVAK